MLVKKNSPFISSSYEAEPLKDKIEELRKSQRRSETDNILKEKKSKFQRFKEKGKKSLNNKIANLKITLKEKNSE